MPAKTKPQSSSREAYRHWAKDVLRYSDTDRQGHVNNAIFATLLETGRVGVLYNPQRPLAPAGTSFVLARLLIEFRSELHWPNQVDIGTAVTHLGRSSIAFEQGLFVADTCVAVSESVAVLIDDATRRSLPLPEAARIELLSSYAPRQEPSGAAGG
jgi:acyl-CoA thioester hydrolase